MRSARTSPRSTVRRQRIRVAGIVQGVGFRPFVYRLARELGLTGFVRNDAAGATIEVEGDPDTLNTFAERVRAEAPPLAVLDRVETSDVPPRGTPDFSIAASVRAASASALVTPDTATCAACLAELFDPADRRYRYPFINCTDCGPRFTIVCGIPYDRAMTTMARFDMCAPCRAEYEDPLDRRFHAQPNACAACGPAVSLLEGSPAGPASGAPARRPGPDPVAAAAAALNEGAIVAVKGLGGYHLACRAGDGDAVRRLRRRKHREDKPFAIMVPDLAAADRLVVLEEPETAWLERPERPIVLARRRPGAPVAEAVAPGHRDLGVMLPYTPLHHLLLADAGAPLVMTSGNVSDEPIAFEDEDARRRLEGIADLFLVHDRPIHTRTDDSVLRVVRLPGADSDPEGEAAARAGLERSAGRESPRTLMLRRSRGFVPVPVPLPRPAPRPLLACGAHLKNTFCLAEGKQAWVGHHIGDLESVDTLRAFEEGIAHFERLFEIEPKVLAHDRHPGYLSTSYAEDRARSGLEALDVQHHPAHLAACLAEHGVSGPAVAAIFDGTGYGTDGTVWGGEILAGDMADFERLGHLWPVPLPGGEAAIRQPWRMACAWLCALRDEVPPLPSALRGAVEVPRWQNVSALARRGVSSPTTTSAGRLFDAVAALCGLHPEVTYEGQAAIALEMAAARATSDGAYPIPLVTDAPSRTAGSPETEPFVLDAREAVRGALEDLERGEAVPDVAARFHRGLARATAGALVEAARRTGLDTAVLSGGVFQNVILLEATARHLAEEGLRTLVPERLPPNDGGISFGQAAVLAARESAA